MTYYGGDYYAGDYYAGGLSFGGFFRGIKRVAQVGLGTVGGFLTGGPAGAIRGTIAAAVPTVLSGIREETLAAGGSGSAYTPELRAKHAAVVARAGGAGSGGSPKPTTSLGPPPGAAGPAGLVPMGPTLEQLGMGPGGQMVHLRRTHWNKHTYVIRGGGTSRWGPAGQLVVVPKGTQAVPNRRMNWANPHALVKAEHRMTSFLHHARRFLKLSGKRGKASLKLKRRKRA